MKNREVIEGISWVSLGFIISAWSATFPFGRWIDIGPGVFPFASGLILICLGSIQFFKARKLNERRAKETFDPLIPQGAALIRLTLCLGGMLLTVALLEPLGFVLTTFFLIFSLMQGIQPGKWGEAVFYALVFALGSYILFDVVLKIMLPRGLLGF